MKAAARMASLRTIDRVIAGCILPEPLFATPSILTSDLDIMQIRNVLSASECERIIHEIVKMDAWTTQNNLKREVSRLCILDDAFAKLLWDRLYPCIQESLCVPTGFLSEGRWVPLKVNPCFRISRYIPGNKFLPHFDAPYCQSSTIKSGMSLVIYLNDDFTGGQTLCYNHEYTRSMAGLSVDEIMRITDMKPVAISPTQGSVVMFPHSLLHSAESLTEGTKFVIRTDLVFQQVEQYSPYFIRREFGLAVGYHMQAQQCDLRNIDSTELYERSHTFRLFSSLSFHNWIDLGKDVWLMIVKYLHITDSYILSLVNRWLHMFKPTYIPSQLSVNAAKHDYYDPRYPRFMYDQITYEGNVEGYLRLTVMQTLVNYETLSRKRYIAEYNPRTGRLIQCDLAYLYDMALTGGYCEEQYYDVNVNMPECSIQDWRDEIMADTETRDEVVYYQIDSLPISPFVFNDPAPDILDRLHAYNSDSFNESNETRVSNTKTCLVYTVSLELSGKNCCSLATNARSLNDIQMHRPAESLIFDFSQFDIKLATSRRCSGDSVCYEVTFPHRGFNHASCQCESSSAITDIQIHSVETNRISLSKMHICVSRFSTKVIHQVRYSAVSAL